MNWTTKTYEPPDQDHSGVRALAEQQRERARRRDEFAKAALTGLLARGTYSVSEETLAAWAVGHADAMLAELDRRAATPDAKEA